MIIEKKQLWECSRYVVSPNQLNNTISIIISFQSNKRIDWIQRNEWKSLTNATITTVTPLRSLNPKISFLIIYLSFISYSSISILYYSIGCLLLLCYLIFSLSLFLFLSLFYPSYSILFYHMMLFYAILYPLILVSLSSWFIPFYRYILIYWLYWIVSLSQLSFYLSSYHTDDNRGNMYYVVSFMYFFKVIWNIDCILIYEMNLKIMAGEVTIECDHSHSDNRFVSVSWFHFHTFHHWLILSIVWWIRSFYSFLSVSLFFVFWLVVVVSSCIICSPNEDYIKITERTGQWADEESFSILSGDSLLLLTVPRILNIWAIFWCLSLLWLSWNHFSFFSMGRY